MNAVLKIMRVETLLTSKVFDDFAKVLVDDLFFGDSEIDRPSVREIFCCLVLLSLLPFAIFLLYKNRSQL